MTGRHSHTQSQPMHADDPVAPGIKRSRSAYFVAAGLLIVVGAVAGITVTLSSGVKEASDKATLSKDETAQLREFLADRSKQRDAERAEVQQQLDDQRAVLCAAIATLSASARPEARTILLKAASDLRCAALPRRTSASPSSTPSPASTTPTRPSSIGDAAAAPRASAMPSGAPSAAGTPGAPRSTSRPSSSAPSPTPAAPKPSPRPAPSPTAPRPSPSTTQPGLLDPVTAPVCNLLHVCL